MVPAHLKRRKRRLFMLYRRAFGDRGFWIYRAGSPMRLRAVRIDRLCLRSWEACKRAAIEAAGGLR